MVLKKTCLALNQEIYIYPALTLWSAPILYVTRRKEKPCIMHGSTFHYFFNQSNPTVLLHKREEKNMRNRVVTNRSTESARCHLALSGGRPYQTQEIKAD